MVHDQRRITLLVRTAASPGRAWNESRKAPNRVIQVDAVSVLPFALDHANRDVDRVVIDGTATAIEYLDLLASLPQGFLGDVVYLPQSGNAYISSAGRGGDRVIYAMTAKDLEFYLQANQLLAA